MKDKRDENIDEFPIRVIHWMIDKNIQPSQGFSNPRLLFSFFKCLKCIENDIILNNNYSHFYILV